VADALPFWLSGLALGVVGAVATWRLKGMRKLFLISLGCNSILLVAVVVLAIGQGTAG